MIYVLLEDLQQVIKSDFNYLLKTFKILSTKSNVELEECNY